MLAFCGIYGWPEEENKHKTWCLIRSLCEGYEGPVVIGGDFNEILSYSEKEGGANRETRAMAGFREVVENCGLGDLRSVGQWYTWERGNSPETRIRERLDRFLVNHSWKRLYPEAYIDHTVRYNSDHAAIVLKTVAPARQQRRARRGFRFETCWLLDENCEEVVKKAWSSAEGEELEDRLASVAQG